MKKYSNHVEPFAVGFLNAEHDDMEYRIACGIREFLTYIPISIGAGQRFAGSVDKTYDNIGVHYSFDRCIWYKEEWYAKSVEAHPECAEELREIEEKIKPYSSLALVRGGMTEQEKDFCLRRVGWGGAHKGFQGHSNPNFGLIADLGTDGLRERLEHYRSINTGKDLFYDSLAIALDSLDILAERYRALAEKMYKTADESDKPRLRRIADAFKTVPKKPAGSLFEAFQAFWLLFTVDGIDSPGRFDQYMIKYYRAASDEEKEYCLDGIWQCFRDTRTWNLCISGSDGDWNDETNELSYDILKTARKFKYHTPNLTMRVHRNTPQALWESATETLATGIGLPAIYNDECVVPALIELGITPEDAHDYCLNGCNQIDIFAKSHMGLEDGEVSYAKCLELTIFNGRCALKWDKLGIETGDPTTFKTFDEFMSAYKRQVEWACDMVTHMANKSQEVMSKYGVNPLRSNFIQACVERGLDYKNHGPLYGHGQILSEGVADTADSLAAIKHFIFDERKYTFAQLQEALKNDFEGYEELYDDFSHYDKFGNDIPYVDAIYKEINEHFYRYLMTKKTFRGGVYGGGCSTYMRAAAYARAVGALPTAKKETA